MNLKIRMFLLVVGFPLLGMTGCSTTGSVSTQTVSGQYPAYLEVATGDIYATAERPVAAGGYVAGLQLPDGSFQPLTHVQGDYPCICGVKKLVGGYTNGRLDLTSGTFHSEGSGELDPPYILGKRDAEGVFTPDQRAVVF